MTNTNIAKGANLANMVGDTKLVTFNVGSTTGQKNYKKSYSGKTTYVVVEDVRCAITGEALLDHSWFNVADLADATLGAKNVNGRVVVTTYKSHAGVKFGFDLV